MTAETEREMVRERERERLMEEEGAKIKLAALRAQRVSGEEVVSDRATYAILVLMCSAAG